MFKITYIITLLLIILIFSYFYFDNKLKKENNLDIKIINSNPLDSTTIQELDVPKF